MVGAIGARQGERDRPRTSPFGDQKTRCARRGIRAEGGVRLINFRISDIIFVVAVLAWVAILGILLGRIEQNAVDTYLGEILSQSDIILRAYR